MLEQQTANILQMGDNARIVAMCAVVVSPIWLTSFAASSWCR